MNNLDMEIEMKLTLECTVQHFEMSRCYHLLPNSASLRTTAEGDIRWTWGDRCYLSFQEMKDSWIFDLEEHNAYHEYQFGIGDLAPNYKYYLERQALIEELKLLEDPTLEKSG